MESKGRVLVDSVKRGVARAVCRVSIKSIYFSADFHRPPPSIQPAIQEVDESTVSCSHKNVYIAVLPRRINTSDYAAAAGYCVLSFYWWR